MKRKEINELREEQEALKGNVDMHMEERFKAWWDLEHQINALTEQEK